MRCYIGETSQRGVLPIAARLHNQPEENTVRFKTLFGTYYPRICRQLTYLLGDRAAAEDLAQETFLKLYQNPPSEWTNPGGWLAKVATNLAYNYLRGEKSRQARETNTANNAAHTVFSLEETISRSQEVAAVRSVLQQMAARDRTCLLLRFSGFSYAEIAGAIGVEKTSVGTILARAQGKFKEKYLSQKGCDEGCAMTKVPSRPI